MILYFMVFGKYFLCDFSFFNIGVEQWMKGIVLVFIVLFMLIGVVLVSWLQWRLGSFYCLGNLVILFVIFCFLQMGYDIFVIVVFWFLYDLMAFMIYSVYDQNCNFEEKKNWIYCMFLFILFLFLILCLILVLVLVNFIECGLVLLDFLLGVFCNVFDKCVLNFFMLFEFIVALNYCMGLWMQILLIIGFFYYYIEGFVWKCDFFYWYLVSFSQMNEGLL